MNWLFDEHYYYCSIDNEWNSTLDFLSHLSLLNSHHFSVSNIFLSKTQNPLFFSHLNVDYVGLFDHFSFAVTLGYSPFFKFWYF